MPSGKPENHQRARLPALTDESFWAEKGRGACTPTSGCAYRRGANCRKCLIATGSRFMGHGDFVQWSRIFGAVAAAGGGYPPLRARRRSTWAWVAAGRYDA